MQQDTETTSSQSKCNLIGHINKSIKEESYITEDKKDIRTRTILWGCINCDLTSSERLPEKEYVPVDHTKCGGPDVCFGCKIKTLQLTPGDARGAVVESGTTQKKWDAELDFYKQARADGIQPEGTNRAAIEKAYEASEVLNKPYDGGTMPKAAVINKSTAEVMKEVGAV